MDEICGQSRKGSTYHILLHMLFLGAFFGWALILFYALFPANSILAVYALILNVPCVGLGLYRMKNTKAGVWKSIFSVPAQSSFCFRLC